MAPFPRPDPLPRYRRAAEQQHIDVENGGYNQALLAEELCRTRISYSISQSAIRECQVNTSSYSASMADLPGGS